MSGIQKCLECKMCDTIINLHERIVVLENAANIKEGVALQPATPAVCNAPENNMQS
jgi:hypothetical protein